MIVMETTSELNLRPIASEQESDLRVERSDISFHDIPGDRVRIEVTVRNEGSQRSRPTAMTLESAPLGAFVPWKSLARLPVPALEPGESRTLSTEVPRPRPAPLGDFDRVPPKRLLTAVNSPDTPAPEPGPGVAALFNLLRRGQSATTSDRALAPGLWELVGREQPHWAGNVNVFVGAHGAHPVERHLSKALRIYPGRANMAMFMVGGPGRPDAYAFELAGLRPDWKAGLYDATNNQTLVVGSQDRPLEESQWVESKGALLVMLVTHPPTGCREGNVEVNVTRRSCGKTAVVEFDLDPGAKGAGCYFV